MQMIQIVLSDLTQATPCITAKLIYFYTMIELLPFQKYLIPCHALKLDQFSAKLFQHLSVDDVPTEWLNHFQCGNPPTRFVLQPINRECFRTLYEADGKRRLWLLRDIGKAGDRRLFMSLGRQWSSKLKTAVVLHQGSVRNLAAARCARRPPSPGAPPRVFLVSQIA